MTDTKKPQFFSQAALEATKALNVIFFKFTQKSKPKQ